MRGKKHTLLGMKMDIKDNIILIDMVKTLEERMKIFGEDASTPVSSPETDFF